MIVNLDNTFIEGLGVVNGNVEWSFGFPGNREEPPEPPGVEEINLTVNGQAVDAEMVFDNEELYERLCTAVAEYIRSIDLGWHLVLRACDTQQETKQ